jgi:hypothetical protein
VLTLVTVEVTALLDVIWHSLPPSAYFPLKFEEVGSSDTSVKLSQNIEILIEALLRCII